MTALFFFGGAFIKPPLSLNVAHGRAASRRRAAVDPAGAERVTEPNDKPAVALGPRIVASGGFTSLYREGMALIEDVAAYLDGAGRAESRGLNRETSFVYATESMRLTTRLMQLASWLLLQRAVNEGEITAENARTEKEKVRFSANPAERGGPGFAATW